MRNYPGWNFSEFHSWAFVLRQQGYEVVSPAELDEQDPAFYSTEMVHYVRRDLEAVIACDAVATMPGWEHSLGAQAEVAVARWLEKKVYAVEVLAAYKADALIGDGRILA